MDCCTCKTKKEYSTVGKLVPEASNEFCVKVCK
jgi:hypothetical protein